jgi:hypothetical protein
LFSLNDYKPHLRNDISLDDEIIYNQHSNLIKIKQYKEAVALLSQNNQIDSVTASLLNSWEQKIYELNEIGSTFYDPYLYSQEEPFETEMIGKSIWQQEY